MSELRVKMEHSDPSHAPLILQEIVNAVADILTAGELLVFIAHQDMKAPTVKKAASIITNRRYIYYEPKVVGSFNFHDVQWQDVKNVHLKQSMLWSDLTVELTDGRTISSSRLQKEQARKAYSFAQQYEQEWRERRRERQMEEDRAKSGGFMINPGHAAPPPVQAVASPSAGDDLTTRLARAKTMLENGLISEAEFNDVKQRILSEL